MKTLSLCILFLSSLAVMGQELNQDNAYFKVYNAAKKAQAKDVQGIRDLYKMSLEDCGDKKLNKMMIKTIMLGMIKSGSKAIKNYMPAVDAKFIELDSLAFLQQSPLQVKCTRCKGDGIEEYQCRECWKGTCKNCKGDKQIGYKGLGGEFVIKKCITCEATGKCLNCEGTGIAKKSCRGCFEKGMVFSRSAIPAEYEKSLKYMVNYIPRYAAGKGIYITDKIIESVKSKELEKELELARKEEEARQATEMARREAERKAAAEKRAARAAKQRTSNGEQTVIAFKKSSGYDDNLQHALLEFNQFFRNRERISRQSLYDLAEAKYVKGKPTLSIKVKSGVLRSEASLRMQYLEAFYNFWKLRCQSNRVGSKVGFIVVYNGKNVAELQDGEIVFL